MFARKKKQWLVIFPLLLFGFITTAQVYQFPYAGKLIIIGGGETPDSVYDFLQKRLGVKINRLFIFQLPVEMKLGYRRASILKNLPAGGLLQFIHCMHVTKGMLILP